MPVRVVHIRRRCISLRGTVLMDLRLARRVALRTTRQCLLTAVAAAAEGKHQWDGRIVQVVGHRVAGRHLHFRDLIRRDGRQKVIQDEDLL